MNREVHVRFWESPEVKVLRATRQLRPGRASSKCGHVRDAPKAEIVSKQERLHNGLRSLGKGLRTNLRGRAAQLLRERAAGCAKNLIC